MVLVLGASSLLYAIERHCPKVKNGYAELILLALKGSRLNFRAKKHQKQTTQYILHNHPHIASRTDLV